MNSLALLGVLGVFVALALVFRRAIKSAQAPGWVMEKPPLPKGLADAVLAFEKWRAEGRLTRGEYEKLMHLSREDAEAAAPSDPFRHAGAASGGEGKPGRLLAAAAPSDKPGRPLAAAAKKAKRTKR